MVTYVPEDFLPVVINYKLALACADIANNKQLPPPEPPPERDPCDKIK